MRFLQEVATIKKLASESNQYVRITKGPKTGSIARVLEIQHINYTNSRFHLEIEGRRKFWMTNGSLEWLEGYQGDTLYNKMVDPPNVSDMLGNDITVGSVIVFNKVVNPGYSTVPEMVIGVVRNILMDGSILAKPILVSGDCKNVSDVYTVKKARCLKLDKCLLNQIMLHKLSN